MAESWTEQRERSNWIALRVLTFAARWIGRRVARALLSWPVALYFLVTAPRARRASREYLDQVLGRPAHWRDIRRHFASYATVSLDRIYVHTGEHSRLSVQAHGFHQLTSTVQSGRGAIVIVSHFGSFELLQTLAELNPQARLRILMDRATGAKANAALEAIGNGTPSPIIDTSTNDVDRVLRVQNALAAGEMVGLMADRIQPGERPVDCDFLGRQAPFPSSPWLLAGLTGAPVLMAFGVYRGGDRYDFYCERLGDNLQLPRRARMQAAQGYAQQYADRLATYAHAAPYNWFNFYHFWY